MEVATGSVIKRRQHLGVQSWVEMFQRFDGAGLTVEEFCRREGLCRSSFTRWRSKLSSSSSRMPAVTPKAGADHKPAAGFVNLGLLGATPSSALASTSTVPTIDLRLDLGGGMSVHLIRR